MSSYRRFIWPLLRRLSPETAHGLALQLLQYGPQTLRKIPARHPALQQTLWGLDFSNPVGMAAGFDKNAEALNGLLALGFGFVEAGTVTPLPQPGNPQPRLFRLEEDRAIINRLGFNNQGLEAFCKRLGASPAHAIIGANIGKNKTSEDAVQDYLEGLEAVYPHASYVTINISSPNTEGLRGLQAREPLTELLSALIAKRAELEGVYDHSLPLLLKIAPDLSEDETEAIAEIVLDQKIDGLIVSNTTIARPSTLRSPHAAEAGGLSGAPLFEPSTHLLGRIYRLTQGRLPLIGVGGIASAEDAYRKIRAGASLVQLYTALIYEGPHLPRRIVSGLAQLLAKDGFSAISDAVGIDAR